MNTSPRPRHAFTLVELLVVITIIGILAGLITAAAIRARISAKQAVVKMEIEQLAMALEHYKTEVGEYPPDFTLLKFTHSDSDIQNAVRAAAQNDILRHIRKRFPRFPYASSWTQLCSHIASPQLIKDAGGNDIYLHYPRVDLNEMDPSSALMFFLGGLPESAGSPSSSEMTEWIPAGFHADPTDPFKIGTPRSKPFFEFNRDRINVKPGIENTAARVPCYLPPSIDVPYVYFKSRNNEYINTHSVLALPSYAHTNAGICLPYLDPPKNSSNPSTWNPAGGSRLWRAPGKFQIISAGLDGQFGEGTYFRYSRAGVQIDSSGNDSMLDEGNFDNLTNFAEGTLGDEMQ